MLLSTGDDRREILAVVDGVQDSACVLAKAAKMASCFSEQWTAVHVSTASTGADPEIVGAAFEQAIQLGGDVLEISAEGEFSALFAVIAERRPVYTLLNRPLTGDSKIAVRRSWQARLLTANLPTTFVFVESQSDRTALSDQMHHSLSRQG
jgi:K+-sensing histidine kinase KdpD